MYRENFEVTIQRCKRLIASFLFTNAPGCQWPICSYF